MQTRQEEQDEAKKLIEESHFRKPRKMMCKRELLWP